MTHPESEQSDRQSHPRGENADAPPAEPSVQDPESAAESGAAGGGG